MWVFMIYDSYSSKTWFLMKQEEKKKETPNKLNFLHYLSRVFLIWTATMIISSHH